jgi:hypothetical protein
VALVGGAAIMAKDGVGVVRERVGGLLARSGGVFLMRRCCWSVVESHLVL